MSNSKQCPYCRLVNNESALRCDCGYYFDTGVIKNSLLSGKERIRLVSSLSRFLTLFINAALLGFLILFFNFIFGDSWLRKIWPWLPTTTLLSYPAPLTFVYYFIFEYYLQRTPGKLLMRTRVEREDGGKPTWGNIFIRTLVRFLPFEIFSGPGQWWHDSWSKTQVVKG